MKLLMENFNKFLAEEEDASQMASDTSMGLPKPYPENKKASGDLERDVSLKISELLFGDPKNPEKILDPKKDIERIHAELEKAFTKDDLEFVFELGTLDEVFDDEVYRKLKNLILSSEDEPSAPTATKWSKAGPTTGDDPDAPFEE